MKKIRLRTLLISISIFCLVYFAWSSIPPTIKPEDTTIVGGIINIIPDETDFNNTDNKYIYGISVSLDKNTSKNLSEQNYAYRVYPYLNEIIDPFWVPYDHQYAENRDSFSLGSCGNTETLFYKQLEEIGFINYENIKETTNITGFTYSGNQFPTHIKFTIFSSNELKPYHDLYLLYVHYEKKWGKDVSWVKAVPIFFE